MKTKRNLVIFAVAVIVALGGLLLWQRTGTATTYFDEDQAFGESYTVPEGERVVVRNGSTLTFEDDLLVQGSLLCEGGPLQLVVRGTFRATGHVQCDLAQDTTGAGNAILIIASKVDVAESAVVIANGSVQVVSAQERLATTEEEIERVYNDAGEWTRDKEHIGPFVPFDEIPSTVPRLRQSLKEQSSSPAATANIRTDSSPSRFVRTAQAQNGNGDSNGNGPDTPEPAEDIEGEPVENTVRVRGTWYVGANPPGAPPPGELEIPTPPPGVKRIVLLFDFGDGEGNILIEDFELTGPDGRPGEAGEKTCNSQGSKGEKAMRFNVRATGNIRVNNFSIHLGAGGEGGRAETKKDCDPGVAVGGEGGESGNLKMVANGSIAIEGSFDIYPGAGGKGGDAVAHGRDGKDGCPAEKGGEAIATGGKGGDNKKGLVVTGSVSGLGNVTIHEIVGGDGGDATANGGNGGNGTGPGCAGGPGGAATATGGVGGDAQSVVATSNGGNGGDAEANPGEGGEGGQGSQIEPGGNGGNGGNAEATEGAPGSGSSSPGQPGTVEDETGGDGGNGGDGCNEGNGGNGGNGEPPGEDGEDGKNLCPEQEQQAGTTGEEPQQQEQQQEPTDPSFDVFFEIETKSIGHVHPLGEADCPDPFAQPLVLSGAPGATWQVDAGTIPPWLTMKTSGEISADGSAEVPLAFTCEITNFEPHTEEARVGVQGFGPDGELIADSFFDVFYELQVP